MTTSVNSALLADFLARPAPNITVSPVDFASANLPEYEGLYAIILDNVLSPNECDTLVLAAEKSSAHPEGWERAMINIGGGRQMLISEERNCGRIIWDSRDVVAKIWKRIAHIPEVQEIMRLEDMPRIFGLGPTKRGEVWKFTRPNERMRFLKYTGGEYFRPHCDGSYETPDHKERSYFTLHLYLNNDSELKGGATTFHPFSFAPDRKLDVLPEAGRILLFQHRYLVHSGADVMQGVKYTMRTDLMYQIESTKSKARSYKPALEDE